MTERVFKAKDRFGNDTEFELIPSNQAIETRAEMEYRKAFSAALKEGLLPRDKMRAIMRDNGIWTDEDDKDLAKLMRTIGDQELKLERYQTEGDKMKCGLVAKNLVINRRKMMELVNLQTSAYTNSCEGMAELIRLEALMAFCVIVKVTGNPYWESYAEYVTERDHNTNAEVASKVIDVQTGLRAESYKDSLDSFPEHKWLNTAREELIKESAAAAAEVLKERKQKVTKKKVTQKRGKSVSRRTKKSKKRTSQPTT